MSSLTITKILVPKKFFPGYSREQYYWFFVEADTNKDDYVSFEELYGALRRFGYPGSDFVIKEMFWKTDVDHNNYISLDEFWAAMGQPIGRVHVCKTLTRLFKSEDKTNTGVVSWTTFLKVLSRLQLTVTKLEHNRVVEISDSVTRNEPVSYNDLMKEIARLWEQIDELQKFWRRADADKDGVLMLAELMKFLKEEGYTDVDVKKKFQEMDADGDGKVTYVEYKAAMTKMSVHVHKSAMMRKLFSRFDKKHAGKIGHRDMKEALEEMGKYFSEHQIHDIVEKVDADKSGSIEYEEFVKTIEEVFAMEDAYEKFFRDADGDNNGYLTVKELVQTLRKGGYSGTEEQIKGMFFSTDVDDDKRIDFEEYMIAMGKRPPMQHKEAVFRQIFHEFDKDQDGIVETSNLKFMFKEMGKTVSDKEMEAFLKKTKVAASGKLNVEEYLKLLKDIEAK